MIKIESSFDTVVEVRLLRLKQGMQILYLRTRTDAVVLGKIESAPVQGTTRVRCKYRAHVRHGADTYESEWERT